MGKYKIDSDEYLEIAHKLVEDQFNLFSTVHERINKFNKKMDY